MFYTAHHPETGIIWDTWVFLHEGTYYLYYLAGSPGWVDGPWKGEQPWDNISLATSTDGVHWTEHGPVLTKRPHAVWMGTGSTWKSPTFKEDGTFYMNFSEWTGPRQTIFMAESTDLIHWTRLGDEYEFVQDERWYHPTGRWDCIWTIDRPGGGLYGYWTATANDETGGQFGFGESPDGKTWTALKPPVVHGFEKPDIGGEVGAIEKFGDRYVMMFGYGQMHTLIADQPEGPFTLAATNPKLLGGNTYFSRFLATDDDLLVCHHSIMRDAKATVHMGLIKRLVEDDAGTLRLAYWPGNDVLKGEAFDVSAPTQLTPGPGATMLNATFDTQRGVILEGDFTLPAGREPVRGFYIDCEGDLGGAIRFDSHGVAETGFHRADGTGWEMKFTVDREMQFASPARFRLILAGSLMEVYLDDILIECFSLPTPATGKIGLLTSDLAAISNITAWKAK
jgi:hypothetical protein